jgi:hypothetical protein
MMNSLGRLLPSLVRGAEDTPHARECAAFTAWNGAVGAGVRRASAPLRLENKYLIVAAVDETWKTQLERLAAQLIFKINSMLGAPMVTRIVFRVDRAAVEAYNRRDETPVAPGDVAACAASLRADAAAIEDGALREQFLRAAGKCLARAREHEEKRRS